MGTPCEAPCWQGITPGKTDEVSALSILADDELIVQDTLECTIIAESEISSRKGCTFSRVSGEGGVIEIRTGIVQRVDLNSVFTLGTAITAFGPPDFIDAAHGSQIVSEGKCYSAHVYYLRGIYISVGGCEPIEFPMEIVSGNSLIVFPDMQSTRIEFSSPQSDIELFVRERFTLPEDLLKWGAEQTVEEYLTNLQPWTGFGAYRLRQSG